MRDDRKLESFGKGPKSSMMNVEGIILAIAQEKANMIQPLTPKEGLQLANSLIDGKEIQKEIRQFHKYKAMFDTMSVEESKSNGDLLKGGYWRGFIAMHSSKIFSLKANGFLQKDQIG